GCEEKRTPQSHSGSLPSDGGKSHPIGRRLTKFRMAVIASSIRSITPRWCCTMSDDARNKDDPDQSSAGKPVGVSVGTAVGAEMRATIQASLYVNPTTFFAPIVQQASLLLQAVVIPGSKTAEGTLIQAVAAPWYDIIALLKDDPGIAF